MKQGYGVFGAAYEVMLRNDPHDPRSIDHELLRRMVRLDPESYDLLYAEPPFCPHMEGHDLYGLAQTLKKHTGETDRAPNPAALRAALEGQVFAMQLRDETRACRDLWTRAGEGTLRGQFLAQLKQKYDAADSDRDRETIVMAARWGLAALDHDEEVVTL